MGKKIALDIVGQKFGKLTVIKRVENSIHNTSVFLCLCDCGTEKKILSRSLVSGKTVSCGCYGKSIIYNKSLVHGQSKRKNKTKEYMAWMNMKNRCYDVKNNHYKSYGGRGIIVCDSWLESFNNFFFDMGIKPSPKHSLDRIDVNGSYCKENCKWSTNEEQARNKRGNVWLEINGEKLIVQDWAKKFNVRPDTIKGHLRKGKTFDYIYDLYTNKKRSKKWERYHLAK